MHQPRPHGLTAVGGALTDEDSAAVELLARRLTNLKTISGVDSLKMVRTLPDGGYVIAQDMGGVFKVITHKPDQPDPAPPFEGIATDYVPMLFSGVVTSAVLRERQGLGMKLTEQARKRIAGYAPELLPPKSVELLRFAIEYHTMVAELAPSTPSSFTFTQYVGQRPTWYSGAMAEVMQVVGGYGRQNLEALPDTPIERARMIAPEKVSRLLAEQLGNVRLPGYTGLPPEDGKFRFDYKFNNTNAVGFDPSGKPWLIRVGASGVHAMPLPLIPATTTAAFREWMEDVADDEILGVLDRFGGMPSGEGFPLLSADFEAWRRAGVIIKVCDTSDFYSHIMYTSAIGWSFNLSGSEGYNTCYDYYDAEGLGYGLAYKMKINLAPASSDGKLPPALRPEDPVDARRLDQYLGSLYRFMASNTPRQLAVKYKLRRVSASQILARATSNVDAEAEYRYWDALELEPIAAHTGSVSEVGRGYLYHGAQFKFQPQIKFPEPFMGGCISHDFLPLINGRYKDSYPNSDTIMFGYYVGDDLKVVKYFRDGGGFTKEVQNDYEECMIVGSWTQVETAGSTTLAGYFYTSDIDERKELSEVVTTTQIEGKDMGYDSIPFFEFDHFFAMPGTLWRNRYFSQHTKTHRTEGNSLSVAICVPYLCRNAAIHAMREGVSGELTTEATSMSFVRDPNSYRYWTYDFLWAWVGGDTSGNVATATSFSPYPRDGSPVWVSGYNYDPYPCSDFADQGDWIGGLPEDITWLVHPNKNEWRQSGGGAAPPFQNYFSSVPGPASEKGDLQISILPQPDLINRRVPSNMYFLASPDDVVGVFYRDACRIVMGNSEYANVSEVEAEGGQRRKYWGFTSLVDHQSPHHFIGVINE